VTSGQRKRKRQARPVLRLQHEHQLIQGQQPHVTTLSMTISMIISMSVSLSIIMDEVSVSVRVEVSV
jgi:hypothetical protein